MELNVLSLFWALAVTASFNGGYWLFLKDRGPGTVTPARIAMTVFVGTLIAIGTYADTLARNPFVMKDCLLLALVAAHGWMAEVLVQSFIRKAVHAQPGRPLAQQRRQLVRSPNSLQSRDVANHRVALTAPPKPKARGNAIISPQELR